MYLALRGIRDKLVVVLKTGFNMLNSIIKNKVVKNVYFQAVTLVEAL